MLLRTSPDEHLLLVTLHHIVGDGWSLDVLVRELGELYRAAAPGGEPAHLPELAVQYADYAVWQRQWLSGPALAEQLAYWRERLAGAPTVLDLPADRPRGPVQSTRGELLPVALPAGLGQDLEALARRAGVTPFMVLLAAFDALLLRWSGQEDLLVGSPIAHRTRLETEGLIGFFVNTLVLRAELAGDPPFSELLGQVRSTTLGAYGHQDVPFEKLVEELAPPRDRSRTPLFQVLLALQNVAPLVLELPGLEVEQLMLDSGTAKFDLSLIFTGAGESLSAALEYNLDLFDRATMERLAGHLLTLLAGVVEDPGRRLSELLLLTPEEEEQLRAWSRTASLPEPAGFVILDLAERDELVPPRTPAEELLAGVFADLLGRPRVGIDDDFFDLGGHSLLATQVMARVRDLFGVELPVSRLFAVPTVEALAREVAAGGLVAALPPVVPVPRQPGEGMLLSYSQERLWFLDRLDPDSPAYNIPGSVRLLGDLDVPAFQKTLAVLVARHETLRTRFAVGPDGGPVQLIDPPHCPLLPVVDLSGLEPERCEAAAAAQAREEACRPFDLVSGPLLRALLLRTGPDEHLLLVTLHHIVGDGWSLGVLVRELSELYRARLEGREPTPSELPELPVQYADYAVWQRQWLSGPALAGQLAYWRERLAGAPTALELPADRPRSPLQGARGALLPVTLPAGVGEDLEALARRAGATPFMVLLAAFDALLLRWSGQEDLLVGSPIAHRTRLETEGLIGFFVNTLVLRAEMAGNPSFSELLGRVRSTALGAYAHQDLPFEKLVEELAPPRDPSRTPLFQVALALQNVAPLVLELPGLEIEQLMMDSGTAKFDLTLMFSGAGESLSGALEYRLELFDPPTVKRFIAQLGILLEDAVVRPGRPVLELALLSPGESHQLLFEWNPGPAGDLVPETLTELFARQAALRPEATAVVGASGVLSYGELARSSRRLARRLESRGVGRGSLVGVCLERDLALPVALLAVLEAGAAYVPLDPGYPAERLAYMLADSGVKALVTESAVAAQLPDLPDGVAVLRLDEEQAALSRESDRPLPPRATPGDLAYVIYTSGSTGRPKGVAVRHAEVARLMAATEPWFGFGPGDVWTLFHSYAFDFSVWELWGALAYGGTLVVVPYWTSRSPEEFRRLLERERVTVLNQTPSAFRQLIASSSAARPWRSGASPPGGTSTPTTAPSSSTSTASPRRRSMSPTGRCGGQTSRRARGASSAAPSPTSPSTCSTAPTSPCPSGWRGSSTSGARASPWGTSAGRTLRRSASCPTPGAGGRGSASTARGTSHAACRTATSSTWAGPTSRSRCGASASSSGRSRRFWRATPGWPRRSWWPKPRSRRAGCGSPPTWSRTHGRPGRCARCCGWSGRGGSTAMPASSCPTACWPSTSTAARPTSSSARSSSSAATCGTASSSRTAPAFSTSARTLVSSGFS
jgi:non-ribosomal peptide synthetase component F